MGDDAGNRSIWLEREGERVMKYRAIILIGLLAMASTAPAQDKQKFAQAQKANSEALRQFTWTSRTELKLKGESKNVKLEQVRYDVDGKIQKTAVGGTPPAQPSSEPSRGLRGRAKAKIIENKKEEFAELMQNLAGLALSYVHMTPNQIQAFAQNATIASAKDGSGIIKGSSVLQPGDSVTVFVDPQTLMIRRVEILSSLEKKAVHLLADFQDLNNGPTHAARAKLQYPEKGIELTIDNYEYRRAGL
jgi:hypothetical protein